MNVQAKIKGINSAKLKEEHIEYIKKEIKARIIYEIKWQLEKLIKYDDISYQFDCFDKNDLIGTLDFDFKIFGATSDNELKLGFNKADSKTELVICDRKD